MGAYHLTLLTTMGISIIFALSLNLITGFCGQISLGHAAFYGVGAYVAAMLAKAGYPFWMTLAPAMLGAACIGWIVGLTSLRVRHDFLAITTMGVGFLFVGIVRQQEFLGGEMGLSGIPGSGLSKSGFALLVSLIALMLIVFSLYIKRSWLGFAFDAIADDEDSAQMIGIDSAGYKLTAFALGTAIAGLAGALYAYHVRFVGPDSFGFIESISVLTMVIIGGIGSVFGVALAAALLSLLPLWFQFIDDYKLLLYSALLFLTMRFSPTGFAGLASRIWFQARP